MQRFVAVASVVILTFLSFAVHAVPKKRFKRAKTAMAATVPVALAPEASGLDFSFSTGVTRTNDIAPLTSVFGFGVEYGFYKSYSVGVDSGYSKELGDIRNESWTGWDDVTLSLSDSELWKHPVYGLTLSGSLSGIIPSYTSATAMGMQYGVSQRFALKHVLSDRLSVTYTTTFSEYSYNYDTFAEEEDNDWYNVQYSNSTRVGVAYSPIKGLRWTNSAGVLAIHTVADENAALLLMGTALAYDANDSATITFGVRSAMYKDNTAYPYIGPAASDTRFLNGRGFAYSLNVAFKI